ncbi:hypothetical protein YC2023_102789 [Brassica napus]
MIILNIMQLYSILFDMIITRSVAEKNGKKKRWQEAKINGAADMKFRLKTI